jgi:uncharacterized membrane protein YbhN (UPF0104 family)
MGEFFHAVRVFFEHLAAVQWSALGVACSCHVARLAIRARAWRAIVKAAYPDARIPRRSVLGAYVAGVGVNAVTPARGGDVVKLYLLKNRVQGATYPTLASTLIVETLFDFFVASILLLWVLQRGVLPSLDVLPHLPSIDWAIAARHPTGAAIVAGALALVLLVLAAWLSRRVVAFKRRVTQGFAILRDPGRYLRQVVAWQAAGWVLRFTAIYWFLKAFDIPATVENAFLVQVVQSLATLLPFTPGGAGTEQGLLVYIFRGEVPATDLLSFSVGMTITLVVTNLLVGSAAILLMLRTLRWRRVAVPREQSARQ